MANEQKPGQPTKLKDFIKSLPPESQERIKERSKELIAEELSLRDLRKAFDLTQMHIAKQLGVGQDSISRLEQRPDLLLSTLSDYIKAMGGNLEVVARFPDLPAVKIAGIGDISDRDRSERKVKDRTLSPTCT